MRISIKFLVPIYTMTFMLPQCLAAIESTTVRTTTVTTENPAGLVEKRTTTTTETTPIISPVVLPTTSTYVLVDPITGQIKGNYDPAHVVNIAPGLIVIDQVTGKIVASVSTTGSPVDVVSAPAFPDLLTAIDTRQAALLQMINDGLNKGTIDAATAASLRSDLDKIMLPKVVAAQNGRLLTYSEALSVALGLNNFADRVVLLTQSPAVVPLIGSRIVSSNGQIIMVDEVTSRRMHLSQRIDDEYMAGRLSANQVSRLKTELDEAAALDSRYRKNGELSESKAHKVSIKLDRVESDINKDVAIINEKRAKIGIRVQ